MATSPAFSIQGTLEKMNRSDDKDFRNQACIDLQSELNKDSFKLDGDSEKKLTAMLLKLLEDANAETQGNAVKCLGGMMKRVGDAQVGEICDHVCNLLLKDKSDSVRDIASLGLKVVIENATVKDGPLLVKRLSQKLTTAVANESVKPETKHECMQALEDLLSRFGMHMIADLEKIQTAVIPQLSSSRPALRKRALGCLSRLAGASSEKLFVSLVEFLIKSASTAKKADLVRTYIQAIGAISVPVGYRLGRHLDQIVPLVIKNVKDAGKQEESDEELREHCLQTLEALVIRCPKEVVRHVPQIMIIALEYLKHDPNYADSGDDMDAEGGDDDDADEEDDAEDDDMSWKVRRASAKVLSAIVSTRPELLPQCYEKIAPALIQRFREREETVKSDVFQAFVALLRQTQSQQRKGAASAAAPLKERTPAAVTALAKQLKARSVKTRVGALHVLRQLATTLPGGFAAQLSEIIPGLVSALGDKSANSNLKIETLGLLCQLLSSHPEAAFQPHLKALVPPVVKAVADNYSKIAAEALRVVAELVRVLRPANSKFDYKPFFKPIFDASFSRLKSTDTDQEVKNAAIEAFGLLLATLGDELAEKDMRDALVVLAERLSNEITRLTAVKVWGRLASSPLKLQIVSLLPDVVKELTGFLRKQHRQLKQGSLATLELLVKNHVKDKATAAAVNGVLPELAPLVSEADLHITQLSLSLAVALIRADAAPQPAREAVHARAMELVQSSLLQGAALAALLAFFGELVASGDKKLTFDALLDSLLQLTRKPLAKQCYSSIAQAVAVLCSAADASKRDATLQRFLKDVSATPKSPDDSTQQMALLCIGELGRRVALDKSGDQLQKAIIGAFESSSEEVKSAASFALGSLAVGSINRFLPFILGEVKAQPKRQYLLLHSLRELISRTSTTADLVPQLGTILPLLFENAEAEEEGTRNVVAECLGKLALANPEKLVPELRQRLSSPSARARSTYVAALKFALVDQPVAADAHIAPVIGQFLEALRDNELAVRRAALLTLNWAAHNKPGMLRDFLPKFMSALYAEAKYKPELVKEVDLGPFKHKVDEGLENRKAAYEALNTLLENCLASIELTLFLQQLVEGLKDASYDIKMLTQLMVVRLANVAGPQLLEALDQLIEPLRATVTFKPPATAVKQEIERNDELVRSALRAVAAIARIENVDTNPKFEEFVRTAVKSGDLAEKYDAIVKADAEISTDKMEVV